LNSIEIGILVNKLGHMLTKVNTFRGCFLGSEKGRIKIDNDYEYCNFVEVLTRLIEMSSEIMSNETNENDIAKVLRQHLDNLQGDQGQEMIY
jgi:hypothetical protein